MRTKVTLVLIFLNVALFFFIFRIERPWRTEQVLLESRRRVLGPEASNIQMLEITRGTPAETTMLVRRNNEWHITKPFEWAANHLAVTRILNDLELLEHDTSFAVADLAKNGQSLADYGLDAPRLTVSFSSAEQAQMAAGPGAASFTLRIGDKTKDGKKLYVLSPNGQRIHVVGRSLAESLSQPIEQLRSHLIFTIKPFEVRALHLQPAVPANLRIRLRTDGNRWTLEAPILAPASKTATLLTVNELNELRVKSFVSTPPSDVSPAANPTLRISLEGNNYSETLYIGRPKPNADTAATEVEYYARMEGKETIFTVAIPTELKSKLDNAQRELRERRLLDFDPREVTAISIAAPNQPELTLQRLESGSASADSAPWQIVRRDPTQGPQTRSADNRMIQQLLDQLSRLSAEEFFNDAPTKPDLEKYGLSGPERVVTLTLASVAKAPPVTKRLEIGRDAESPSLVFARVSGAEYVYQVSPEILRQTPVRSLDYRDRVLRELPPGAQIVALKLMDTGTKEVILERTVPPTPETGVAAPAASATDEAVETLRKQLTTLRAKAFVADEFTTAENVAGEERPWKYQLDTVITLVGGPTGAQTSVTTLFIGERQGGTTQRAASAEFRAVWELEQPFIDALWTITDGARDPGPPRPATDARPAAKAQ